jgi:hypothetical protein
MNNEQLACGVGQRLAGLVMASEAPPRNPEG